MNHRQELHCCDAGTKNKKNKSISLKYDINLQKGTKMNDEYIETSHRGYFQRIGDSIKGIVGGIALICISTYGLYWNETRVDLSKIAEDSAIYIKGDTIDSKTLISYTGISKANGFVGDNEYIKPLEHIVAMTRTVEMYAWEEHSESKTTENANGSSDTTTKYTYSKAWTSSPKDSSSFKNPQGHENPQAHIATGSKTYKSDNIRLDDLKLDSSQLAISGWTALPLTKEMLLNESKVENNYIYFPQTIKQTLSQEQKPNITNQRNNELNTTIKESSLASPLVGDIRIGYKITHDNAQSTVFGLLDGDLIKPFKIKNEDIVSKMSGGLYRLFQGDRETAISSLSSEENLKLWGIRIISLLMLFAGFNALFAPINSIFNILKISTVTRMATSTISFVLTAIVALIAIFLGKLASFAGFLGAIIMAIIIVFGIVKLVFAKKSANIS